jgi:hypothetical protein
MSIFGYPRAVSSYCYNRWRLSAAWRYLSPYKPKFQDRNQQSVTHTIDQSTPSKDKIPNSCHDKRTLVHVLDEERGDLLTQLDELRELLLVADAKYENATSIAERDSADEECHRLRAEIHFVLSDFIFAGRNIKNGAQVAERIREVNPVQPMPMITPDPTEARQAAENSYAADPEKTVPSQTAATAA